MLYLRKPVTHTMLSVCDLLGVGIISFVNRQSFCCITFLIRKEGSIGEQWQGAEGAFGKAVKNMDETKVLLALKDLDQKPFGNNMKDMDFN